MSIQERRKEAQRIREEGRQAALDGRNIETCPYRHTDRYQWEEGYRTGECELSMREVALHAVGTREDFSIHWFSTGEIVFIGDSTSQQILIESNTTIERARDVARFFDKELVEPAEAGSAVAIPKLGG
jgi:ribosome modulation factor